MYMYIIIDRRAVNIMLYGLKVMYSCDINIGSCDLLLRQSGPENPEEQLHELSPSEQIPG